MSENYKYRVVIYEKRGSDKTGATVVDVKCDDFDLKYKRKGGKMGRITMEWEEKNSKEEKSKAKDDKMAGEKKEKEEKKKDKKKDDKKGMNSDDDGDQGQKKKKKESKKEKKGKENDVEKKKKKKSDKREEEKEEFHMVDDEKKKKRNENENMKKQKENDESSESEDDEKKKEKTSKRKNGGKEEKEEKEEEKVDDKKDGGSKKKEKKSKKETSKEIINFKPMGEKRREELKKRAENGHFSKVIIVESMMAEILPFVSTELLMKHEMKARLLDKEKEYRKEEWANFRQEKVEEFLNGILTLIETGTEEKEMREEMKIEGSTLLSAIRQFMLSIKLMETPSFRQQKGRINSILLSQTIEVPTEDMWKMIVDFLILRNKKSRDQ